MKRAPPTSDELLSSPELAVLHALEAVLVVTERSLLAAHPQLEEEDLCADAAPRLRGTGWIADALLLHISAMTACLSRYQAAARRERVPGHNADPF